MPKPKPRQRATGFRAFMHRQASPIASWMSLGLLSAVVGVVLYAEREYAHAADVSQKFSKMETGQEINRLTIETSTLEVKLQLLRAQLSQVTYAQGAMTRDRAAEKERLATEIGTLNQDLSTKKQLLDRMRTGTK